MMTAREIEITRMLLEVLRLASPTLLSEPVLHANVAVRQANEGQPKATRDEFETALRMADAAGTVRSVRNEITGAVRWTISEQGRVALKEI